MSCPQISLNDITLYMVGFAIGFAAGMPLFMWLIPEVASGRLLRRLRARVKGARRGRAFVQPADPWLNRFLAVLAFLWLMGGFVIMAGASTRHLPLITLVLSLVSAPALGLGLLRLAFGGGSDHET